jgi:hypothetical protein
MNRIITRRACAVLDKSYLVEYEYRESENTDLKTGKEVLEAFSGIDARYQVTVKAIEELNRTDIRILFTRTVNRS